MPINKTSFKAIAINSINPFVISVLSAFTTGIGALVNEELLKRNHVYDSTFNQRLANEMKTSCIGGLMNGAIASTLAAFAFICALKNNNDDFFENRAYNFMFVVGAASLALAPAAGGLFVQNTNDTQRDNFMGMSVLVYTFLLSVIIVKSSMTVGRGAMDLVRGYDLGNYSLFRKKSSESEEQLPFYKPEVTPLG